MTSSEWTAWISAAAAVVQAVGAALAIFYTVKLARESAQREANAILAEDQRQKEAVRKNEERIAALDAAERARIAEEDLARHNEPIQKTLGFARSIIGELRENISDFEGRHAAGHGGQYAVPQLPEQFALARLRGTLVEQAVDAESARAIDALCAAAHPPGATFLPPAEMVAQLLVIIGRIEFCIPDLERQLRT